MDAANRRHVLAVRAWVRISHDGLDERLANGADPAEDLALGVRAAQLQAPRYRRRLAGSLERVVMLADRGRLPTLAATQEETLDQILEARSLLLEVAEALRAGEPPGPRGIAMVERLLRDDESPIYANSFAGHLTLTTRVALDHLA